MEIFKDIKNYEGLYKISNTGKVYSFVTNKTLKPYKQVTRNTTYDRVYLVKNKVKVRYLIHRLVAEAFIDNPDNKPCVNHIDNNGSNNNVDNLEWCTYSENLLHAQKQGRLFEAQSKGGKNRAESARLEAENFSISLVGQVLGKFKVIEHIGLKPVGNKGIMRHTFNLECQDCGSFKTTNKEDLIANPNSCRTCDTRSKTMNRFQEVMDTLINTRVNNWLVVSLTTPSKGIRTSKVSLKCDCGNTKEIGYGKLPKVGKCTNCKG